MSATVNELLRQALELEPKARAELAALLLDSVQAEPKEVVDSAWAAEVARRVRELESGSVATIPWEDVRDRLLRGPDAS
jgi:putative addiction module component (TIGR02574 family)